MHRTLRTATGGMILAVVLLLCGPAQALAAKTVLRLRLDGPVLEGPNDAAGLMALLTEEEFNTLHDWVRTIRQASRDPKIDGLLLIIEEPQISLAQVEELSRSLQTFRDRGKPVYCYMDYAANLTYALATAADHITIAENSDLAIMGLHGEMVFFKGLLDKIGVEADMLHCGAYKSALEPFTRTEPSPEAAENVNWLLDGLYERWIEMIATGRSLPADEVKNLVDRAPLTAAQALQHKLVDDVSSFTAFKKRVYKEFGKDVTVLKEYEQGSGTPIDMNNPFAFFEFISRMMEGVKEPSTPGIALIFVEGPIIVGTNDDSPFGGAIAGSTTIRAALEEARLDDKIKAVVVRVDSPGGSALASDIIWNAAKRCADEKPLIVSMGGVAGSGGYYVSVPADTIFAEASTLTASIGVVGGKLVWKDLMENKLGITTTEFSRGKHAGLMTMSRKWDESERAWITAYMNTVYEQFKNRVLASRGDRLKKDIEELAAGRVFTGQQALELGLVDQLGGLSDALAHAAKKAGLGRDYETYLLPKASGLKELVGLIQQLMSEDGEDEFEVALAAHLGRASLPRLGLPLLQELSPTHARELLRALHNLTILRRERVGCFMPFIPQVH